jgi:translation initiation factor IF-1
MSKQQQEVLEGKVEEILAGGFFRIRCNDNSLVLAKLKRRLSRYSYRLMEGDQVQVQVSPSDKSTGLICKVIGK